MLDRDHPGRSCRPSTCRRRGRCRCRARRAGRSHRRPCRCNWYSERIGAWRSTTALASSPLVGGTPVNSVDRPLSRLSNEITRNPRADELVDEPLRPVDQLPAEPHHQQQRFARTLFVVLDRDPVRLHQGHASMLLVSRRIVSGQAVAVRHRRPPFGYGGATYGPLQEARRSRRDGGDQGRHRRHGCPARPLRRRQGRARLARRTA